MTPYEKLKEARALHELRKSEAAHVQSLVDMTSTSLTAAKDALKAAEICVGLGPDLTFRVEADDSVVVWRSRSHGPEWIGRTSPAHIAKFVEELVAAGVLRFETAVQCVPVKVEPPKS